MSTPFLEKFSLIKKSFLIGLIQFTSYSVLCINFRAVAQADYTVAVLSDLCIATLNYFIIKFIALSNDSPATLVGYVVGSCIGSVFGIYVSTHWL